MSGGSGSDFSGALAKWKEIDLPALQRSLDEHAPVLRDGQVKALVNRKSLADKTREHKRSPPETQLETFKPLLKQYQSEIDELTKRSKAAETAFFAAQGALQGAPDPYGLLEILVDQTAAVASLDSLKAAHSRLQAEVATLRSNASGSSALQSERDRLSTRLASLESSLETRVAERIASAEAELAARWDERLRNHTDREESLTRGLAVAQDQLATLRAAHEQATARLVELGEREAEGETHAVRAQQDLNAAELERANARVAAVEARNEALRAEVERVRAGRDLEERSEALTKERDEWADRAQREEAARSEAEARIAALQEEREKEAKEAESRKSEVAKEVQSLRARVNACVDYEEISRELEILKQIEFGEANEEEDADTAAEESGKSNIEKLLLGKNRKLLDQVTTLRVENNELNTKRISSERELTSLRDQVARLRALNARLEEDLVTVDTSASRPSGAAAKEAASTNGKKTGGSAAMSAEETLAEMDRIGSEAAQQSTKSSIAAEDKAVAATKAGATAGAAGAPSASASGASSSILPIITSQRDRFRSRNAELEEELRKQSEVVNELRAEVRKLQADNLGLYEKVRYLSSYRSEAQSGGSTPAAEHRISMHSSAGLVGAAARNEYPPPHRPGVREDAYKERYEQSMNPFEQFRGREQSRAIASLNPLERLLHMLTRLVLGHRRARVLFMVYALLIHLLLFSMLFELGHSHTRAAAVGDVPAPGGAGAGFDKWDPAARASR